jgi:hypothetical protein
MSRIEILFIPGILLIAAGIALISHAAAVIFSGVALIGLAFAAAAVKASEKITADKKANK